MKKFLLVTSLTVIANLVLNAQIYVDNAGRVGVGTLSPNTYSLMNIGKDGGQTGSLMFYESSKGGKSFKLFRENDRAYMVRGGDINAGMSMSSYGNVSFRTSTTYSTEDVTSVYLKNASQRAWVVYWGSQRRFYVDATGEIFYQGQYRLSDKRFKENISDIDKNHLKLNKVRVVSYYMKDNANFTSDTVICDEKKIDKKLTYGFLAQELEKVYPEMVKETETGVKAVDYVSFIPLLVQAYQDHDNEIKALQEELAKLKVENNSKLKSDQSGIESSNDEIASTVYIEQNNPNPFSESTNISMHIPEAVYYANFYIYTLNGTLMYSEKITERGNASISIDGNSLEPGIYLYSLVCDSEITVTKQMILTE